MVCYGSAYLLIVIFVSKHFLGLSHPVVGYAWLPQFGETFLRKQSEEFSNTRYLALSEYGYDGQFYAKMALDPLLLDPQTPKSFDNPIFRARRVLFSAIPYALGAGNNDRIVQLYSFQNYIFWLGTAILLLYWLPPTNWQNAIRYALLLLTSGLMTCLTRSLLDAPAMTIILLGMLLIDRKKEFIGSGILAFAGLGKETSIFAAAGFSLPKPSDFRTCVLWILKGAIVVIPLGIWYLYINQKLDGYAGQSLGSGAFDWPFAGWAGAVQKLVDRVDSDGWLPHNYLTALFLFSLPLQAFCILVRPQPRNPWWRVGSVFAIFTFLTGPAVWEGVTGSAIRVALPLTFAFTILHPRKPIWLPVLLAGNLLTFIGVQDLLATRVPIHTDNASPELQGRFIRAGAPFPTYNFQNDWYGEEALGGSRWRWSGGHSSINVTNPAPFAIILNIECSIHSREARTIQILRGDDVLQSVSLAPDERKPIAIEFVAQPGTSQLRFESKEEPTRLATDSRELSFAIENYTFFFKQLP